MKKYTAAGGVPYIATSDSRSIRYPDPSININDSVKVRLSLSLAMLAISCRILISFYPPSSYYAAIPPSLAHGFVPCIIMGSLLTSQQFDLESKKITEFVPFEVGNLVVAVGGSNIGRVGVVLNREKHPGSHDIVHVKDAVGHTFATRLDNIFVIGKGTKSLISLPKAKGVRRSLIEDRAARLKARGEL